MMACGRAAARMMHEEDGGSGIRRRRCQWWIVISRLSPVTAPSSFVCMYTASIATLQMKTRAVCRKLISHEFLCAMLRKLGIFRCQLFDYSRIGPLSLFKDFLPQFVFQMGHKQEAIERALMDGNGGRCDVLGQFTSECSEFYFM